VKNIFVCVSDLCCGIFIPSWYQISIKALILQPWLFMDDMCKNLRGTFVLLKWMKWESKSSNSKSILNNMRIEIMMMRTILKLALLVTMKMMLMLSITYLTINQITTVLHLITEEEEVKDLIMNLIRELIFLNLKGKWNLMSSLIGSKPWRGFSISKSFLNIKK